MQRYGLARKISTILIFLMLWAGERALADEPRGPFAIAGGAAFPISTTAGLSNGTQVAGGIEYGFLTTGASGTPFVYLDFRSSIGLSAAAVGVGYSTESLTRQRPYGGLGVSYSYVDIFNGFGCSNCTPRPPPHPPCVDNCGPNGPGSKLGSGIGGKIFVGFGVAPGFSLEASYDVAPHLEGVNTDAALLRLKYRFK